MKNKKRLIKAICAFLVIAIGFFVWYNPELMPAFGANRTVSATNPDAAGKDGQTLAFNTSGSGNQPPTPNSALLRDTVKILDEEQSKNVQSKINYVEYDENFNLQIKFSQMPEEMNEAKAGEVFLLPYVEGQFFPDTYIAKIEDIKPDNGGYVFSLSTPAIDEIFEKFDLNVDSTLTKENLIEVNTLPGVKVSYEKKDFEELAHSSGSQKQKYTFQPLVYNPGSGGQIPVYDPIASKESDNGSRSFVLESDGESLSFVLELEDLDLIELYDLADRKLYEVVDEIFDDEEDDDDSDDESDDKDVEDEEDDDEGFELVLNGKIGVEDIKFYNVAEFGIQYPLLFNNLVLGATGNFVTEVTVDAKFKEADIEEAIVEKYVDKYGENKFVKGSDEDKFAMDWKMMKIEGLKENTFTLAHVLWNVGTAKVTRPDKMIGKIDKDELIFPLTAGIVISADFEGNISIKAFAELSYKHSIDTGRRQVIKNKALDIENLGSILEKEESEFDWQVGVEASGDMDLQFININAGVYIFNVNITRFTFTALGTELQGKGRLAFGKSGFDGSEVYGYACVYSSLVWRVNVSVQTKQFLWWKLGEMTNFKLDFTWELWRKNWFELGELPTDSDNTMGFNHISAYDGEYIYYKDVNGYLSRINKDNTGRTTLMPDDFFIIAGIDNSFIYVMKKEEKGKFALHRVNKEDGTDRKIAENIANCLTSDDEYLYIVPADEQNKVRRLNKKTLILSDFAVVDKGLGGFLGGLNIIQDMYTRNDSEFLLISHESTFFSSKTHYYIVDKESGNAVEVPREYQYFTKEPYDSYFYVVNLSSAGFLRGVADNVYWQSKDGTTIKEIRGISGWNPSNEGIFIQNYNSDEATKQELPYVITLAQASDGELRNLWNTASQQAFFTLMKYKGKWYFIDQTASDYVLYVVDSLSDQPRELERVAISNYSIGLDKCSTAMINGIIFFYSIDGDNSTLLYKYNLNDADEAAK